MSGHPGLLPTLLPPDLRKPGLSGQAAGLRLGTAGLQGAHLRLRLSPGNRAAGNLKSP